MRAYELVLVTRPSLSDAQKKKLLENVKSWLKPASQQGGDVKVAKEEEWGQKPLSYRIKGETNGFYTLLNLEGKNAIPTDLEKRILAQEDILRHLVVRTK